MQKLTGKKVFLNLGQPGTEFVYDLIGTNITLWKISSI